MSGVLRAQKMLRNHFYHLPAFICKELSFVLKKMMRILNSFHGPNYITLKEKIFSTKYVIIFNQIDLLIQICFVFLRTYEIYDNQTKAIPVR